MLVQQAGRFNSVKLNPIRLVSGISKGFEANSLL